MRSDSETRRVRARRQLRVTILLGLTLVVSPSAHAYLDPASGSLLLQLILGGVAGLALAVKMFWHRILGFFGRRSDEDESRPS